MNIDFLFLLYLNGKVDTPGLVWLDTSVRAVIDLDDGSTEFDLEDHINFNNTTALRLFHQYEVVIPL